MAFDGYTKPTSFLIDAGILKVGTVPAAWGVTRGGLSFDPAPTFRQVEGDGLHSPIATLDRITGYGSFIEGTIIEAAAASLSKMSPGSSSASSGDAIVLTSQVCGELLDTTDYLRNLRFIQRRNDNKTYEVVFDYALVTQRKQVSLPNNETGWQVRIEARLAPGAALNTCPFTEEIIDE